MEIPHHALRTPEYLLAVLKTTVERLHLKDWDIDLMTIQSGDPMPARFEDCDGHPGAAECDEDALSATILINYGACVREDRDPANVLRHEVAHIFLDDSRNEEVKSNVIAELLGTQI